MVCIFCTSNCKDISQQVNVMSVNGTFGCHFEFFPPSCSFHKMGTALDIFLVRNGNNWHQIRNSRWPGSVDINIIRIHNIVMTSSLCDVITLLSCKSMKPIIYPMKAGIILVSMVYDTLTHPRWYRATRPAHLLRGSGCPFPEIYCLGCLEVGIGWWLYGH